MIEAVRRQQAAQATVDRFQHVPFAYGEYDCVRMAAFVLRQMGYEPYFGRAGTYSTAVRAYRALKRAGYATLAEAMDAQGVPRIAPARALPADLILGLSEGLFDGTLFMAVGNGRVLGYHQDLDGADILQPTQYLAAWRL